VVVEPTEAQDTTASGIILPDTAQEKPQRGKVVAVGEGRVEDGKRVPLELAVGDIVMYAKYGGTEVNVNGDEAIILRESDILAKEV
jgi:chaperonin GroES